jgi:hypothetical protein
MLKKSNRVLKTSFDEEQKMKDEAFLKLTPLERLRIHEEMRRRIWGDKYNKTKLTGLKVTKKTIS